MDDLSQPQPPGTIEGGMTNPSPPKGRRVRAPLRSDDLDARPKKADEPEPSNQDTQPSAANALDENDAPPGMATSSAFSMLRFGANKPKKAASSRFEKEKPAPPSPKEKGAKSGWGEDTLVSDAKQGRRSVAGRRRQAEESSRSLDEDVQDEDEDSENGAEEREKENRRKSGDSRDDVIMIIPDLNDVEEDEMITTVAAPPSLKVNKVKTIRELDNELALSTGILNEQTGMDGIDFTLLTGYALCPPEMVYEEDKHWDWDVTFTEITTEEETR
ncbi:intraflagellar transport protein 43-domain-containing protein [Chytriomyces cf. hyalinus JEL632]|nr:intraflagellar transport protein 43-domain-containing protein [Chytriomyces cf. hyalinus JEL632]